MSFCGEVDCEICKYLNSSTCFECMHYEYLEDNFEPLSKEALASREEILYKERLSKSTTGKIECNIPEEFRNAFHAAQRCSSREHSKRAFLGVFIPDDSHLAATDNCKLIHISCNSIPSTLVGKIVMTLDEHTAGINEDPFPNHQKIIDSCSSYSVVPFSNIRLEENTEDSSWQRERKSTYLVFGDHRILINSEYLNTILEILNGEIKVGYSPTNNILPVMFTGDNGQAVICPINQR